MLRSESQRNSMHVAHQVVAPERLRVLRVLLASVFILILPIVLWTAYLEFSRSRMWGTVGIEFVAGGVALASGIVGIWLLPIPKGSRLLASAGYVPLAFVALTIYGFIYIGARGFPV